MGFDVKALIAKVEAMVNGEGASSNNGKIDTKEEVSIFRQQLNSAVQSGQLTNEDAKEIFGLYTTNASKKSGGITIINNITINIDIEIDNSAMEQLLEQLLNHMTTIENLLQQIQNGQISQTDLQDFLTLLFQQYFTNGSDTLWDYLEQIISSLGNIEGLQESIQNILLQQLNQFTEIRDDLRTLINTVRQGNQTLEEQNEMLRLIYETLNAFKDEANAQLGDITGYLQTLINLVNSGNMTLEELKGLIAAIKQDTSDQKEISKQILEAIGNLGGDIATSLTAILNAINTGNQQNVDGIADLKALLNQILTAINNQTLNDDDNTQRILDALAGLTISGGQIDLSSLENMLQTLIGLVTAGNNTLTDIDAKLNLLNLTVNSISQRLADLDVPNYENILNQILAALGENSQYDDAQVLALLKAILEAIEACCGCGDGDTNEGVIIDGGNMFSIGAQPTDDNTFGKDGDGLAAAIQYILANPNAVINAMSSTGNLSGIEDVKENVPQKLQPGMATKISLATRPDLKEVFNQLGIQDNQVYIMRMADEKQAQVIDLSGRRRGIINDEEVLKKIFQIQ